MARIHRPDLILMDIQLPVPDGYEATRQIKSIPALQLDPDRRHDLLALSGDDVMASTRLGFFG